jgi:multidrug transporter EmrE-like cation transporter
MLLFVSKFLSSKRVFSMNLKSHFYLPFCRFLAIQGSIFAWLIMKHILLLYLISWGILFTIWDIFLKKWSTDDKYLYYFIGFIFYIIGIILFSLTLKGKNLWVANTILVTSNIVLLALVSYFYFHEKLSMVQVVWLVFSIIGVVLLEIGE